MNSFFWALGFSSVKRKSSKTYLHSTVGKVKSGHWKKHLTHSRHLINDCLFLPFNCALTLKSVTKLNLNLLAPCSKAKLLALGCGEGEYSVYCRLSSKEKGKLMLKRPELPNGFLERIFKGNLWTSLVSSKVTGWCCRNLNIQPSGSDWSGLYMVVVSMQSPSSTWVEGH